jgi:hypothetical protein
MIALYSPIEKNVFMNNRKKTDTAFFEEVIMFCENRDRLSKALNKNKIFRIFHFSTSTN